MMLNKQGEGKIDWCDWSWNPISGCKHGCGYCYIKKMDNRYGSNIMEPKINYDRFEDLIKCKKLKKGDKIFVGSSGDMWGEWVEKEEINGILFICKSMPDYNFQFLTKNPKRYSGFDIPKNCLRGMTIDTNDRALKCITDKSIKLIDFISFEPLLECPDDRMLYLFENVDIKWIIIGGESCGTKKPDEWADEIIAEAMKNGIPVWVKDNYKFHTRIKEHIKG